MLNGMMIPTEWIASRSQCKAGFFKIHKYKAWAWLVLGLIVYPRFEILSPFSFPPCYFTNCSIFRTWYLTLLELAPIPCWWGCSRSWSRSWWPCSSFWCSSRWKPLSSQSASGGRSRQRRCHCCRLEAGSGRLRWHASLRHPRRCHVEIPEVWKR